MSDRDKILIIEDDSEIASVLIMNISDLDLETVHASDGELGLSLAKTGKYSLIILDIMLPKIDGLTLCKEIRSVDEYTPIMMLTAKAEEIDRILGLELGADDYVVKPFSVREVLARIKAILRRSKNRYIVENITKEQDQISIGGLSISFEKRKVFLNQNEIELTVKEFELLTLFAKNPGRAFSRTDLLNLVWGYNFEGYEHTVNTHINRLRNKIETDPANPQYLKTVWGIGYRFSEKEEF